MEIFPADIIAFDEIQIMINELLKQRLIVEYEIDGKKYWRITGWKHQKIEYPTYKYPNENGEIPTPPKRGGKTKTPQENNFESNRHDTYMSPTCSRQDDDMSLLREEKLREEKKDYSLVVESQKTSEPEPPEAVPYAEIVKLYHAHLPMLPKVEVLSDKRKTSMKVCWNKPPTENFRPRDMDWWVDYFGYVGRVPFLIGENRNGWKADFEFLVNFNNLLKVMEGKYERS